jgi:hypothetical protein
MSLVPAKHNFTINEGATFYQRIFFKVEGAIQDLSGYSSSLVLKDEPNGTVLLTLDTGVNEGITLGGAQGTIDLTIDAADTKNLPWKTAVYKLFVTDPTSRTDVLLSGSFKVIEF